MHNLRWTNNDVEKLLALNLKYRGDRLRPSKVYNDWEALRVAGELDNCVVRSKKALQTAYSKNKPREVENDPAEIVIVETDAAVQQEVRRVTPEPEHRERSVEPRDEGRNPQLSADLIAVKDSLWAQVQTEFKRACKAKGMKRLPLVKPKRRIPLEFQDLGDALICDLLIPLGESASFEKLNCAVYAVGKVILAKMRGDQGTHCKEAIRAQMERVQQSKRLSKFLAWTQEEIHRRENHTRPNERQTRQLKKLRSEFKRLKQLPDFRRLKETLLCKLRIVNRRIAAREDEVKRRRVRLMPLKRALESCADPVSGQSIPVNEVRDFWAGIIGRKKEFVKSPELVEWRNGLQVEPQVINLEESARDWEMVCQKAKSWKAPGPDGISGAMWKAFPTARNMLHKWILKWIRGEKRIPQWFTHGRAILLYKKGDRLDPSNYRTICCLNTAYKLATGLITQWLRSRLDEIGALPQEQLAIKKGIWACTEAHFLDATVTSDALYRSKRKRSEVMSMAWIDFAKAFDSVPHSYIRWVLRGVGLDQRVRLFLRKLMQGWSIQYEQYKGAKCLKSRPLQVINGVLQGDALSPLLYCACIAPISHWLNRNIPMYVTAFGSRGEERHPLRLNHLYYVDDLKIYTPTKLDLERAVEGVNRLSEHMGLSVNVEKSAVAHIPQPHGNDAPSEGALSEFPIIGKDDVYKYLGLEQSERICYEALWERVSEVICKRTKSIFSSRMSIRQMVNGYNAIIPAIVRFVGTCSVVGKGAFNRQRATMQELDTKVRKILVGCKVRFPWQSTYRLYAAPSDGGLGLRRISDAYEESVVYAYSYLTCSPSLTVTHQFLSGSSTQRNVLTDFEQIMRDYGVHAANKDQQIVSTPGILGVRVRGVETLAATKAARTIVGIIKAVRADSVLQKLGRSGASDRAEPGFQMAAMNTDYDRWGMDRAHTWAWLKRGVLGPVVIRNIIAAQDNQLLAGYHRNIRVRCRFACKQNNSPDESVAHIVSGCEYWSSSLYTERHNMVANDIYLALCKKYDLPTNKYQSRISDVQVNERAKLYWNRKVETGTTMMHNQPDIVCFEFDATDSAKVKRIWVIEVAVPWYQNLREKEKEKYHRYAINSQSDSEHPDVNLQSELGKLYACRVETVPIVVGVFGEVSVNFTANLRKLELPIDIEKLIERVQRSAVMGTHWVIKAHLSVPIN